MEYSGQYRFVPSIHSVKGTKYSYLVQTYHAIFEKTIDVGQKDLTDKEKQLLWEGIIQTSEYIAYGFNYIIHNNYDKKSQKSKIMSAMYCRLCALFGEDEYRYKIEHTILDIAQNSVLYSLGIDSYKNNKAFVWDKTKPNRYATIIKHATEVVFVHLCHDYFASEIKSIDAITESPEDFVEIGAQEALYADEIIEKAGLSKKMPRAIEEAVINYLDHGETDDIKAIQPYLDIIYKRLYQK